MNHPAKFSKAIIVALAKELKPFSGAVILDPFAGVGGIHVLQDSYALVKTWGVEIEPEWASEHSRTIVGDATNLPHVDGIFDGFISSPTYGNRMGDKYDGRDGSRRSTYRIALGRMPSNGSSAVMQFGLPYCRLHEAAWAEAFRVTSSKGFGKVNVSNHIRKGKEVNVVGFHCDALRKAGWKIAGLTQVHTPRMRMGANHAARVSNEVIISVYKA